MKELRINDISFKDGVMKIYWSGSIGFGVLTVHQNENGNFEVETECLGKEFYHNILELAKKYIMSFSTIVE